jgi:hypothetical protein
MARALRAELARSNPFRLTGTALPPNVLLAGKMIVLCLALLGYPEKLPEIHLPMIRAFDLVPDRAAFRTAMIVVFYAGAVGLLLNRWVRASAFLAGFVFFLEPLVARAHFWYGNFFCAAMLLLMGLYREPIGIYLLRWQMVIMYLGSGLNKALQADWWSGRFFIHLFGRGSPAYASLAERWGPEPTALFVSWTTIAIELTLAVCLAVPRLYRPGVWLALSFHLTTVLFAGGTFGIFVGTVLFSLLIFVDWPAEPGSLRAWRSERSPLGRILEGVSRRLDVDRLFDWTLARLPRAPRHFSPRSLEIGLGRRAYRELGAFNLGLLRLPAVHFFLAVLISKGASYRIDPEIFRWHRKAFGWGLDLTVAWVAMLALDWLLRALREGSGAAAEAPSEEGPGADGPPA